MDLRCATTDDAKLLFTLRNDRETRKHSQNPNEISWEEHLAWLNKSLKQPTRKLYLAESEGVIVGVVRSDKNEDGTVELSWTVAPSQRGKGLGKAMVLQFTKQFHPNEKLIATIQKGNIPSEKIAQALGLHQETTELSEALKRQSFMVWR